MNIKSESDEFYATSEEAMHAVDAAFLPGNFLVDTFPSRTCFSQKKTQTTSQRLAARSEICPRVVPRRRFQEVREESEETSRRPVYPPVPTRQGIFPGS